MSSADSGRGSRDRAAGVWCGGCRCCSAAAPALAACGDGGFRPLYGTDGGRRRRRRAPGAGRRRADPGPRRPAHPQRADLPEHRRRQRRCRPRTGSKWCSTRSLTSTLVRIDGEAEGQIYAVQASFRSSTSSRRRSCSRARATRAPASSASSRSTPTCARARTPRTAPRGPSPTTSRPGLRPTSPARA